MNSNKKLANKVQQAMALALVSTAVITTAATVPGVMTAEAEGVQTQTVSETSDAGVTTDTASADSFSILAGATEVVFSAASAPAEVSESETEVTAVASSVSESSEADAASASDEESVLLMADVDDKLNIRKSADDDSEIVGYLEKGDTAEIIKEKDGWYKIKSGNVKGYVLADYCVTGKKAEKLNKKLNRLYAKATTDGLRVRDDDSKKASVVKVLNKGDKIQAVSSNEKNGWIKVKYNGETAYVSADYVKVKRASSKAETVEEYQKKIEAQKAAEEKAAAEKAAAQAASTASTDSSSSDTSTAVSADVSDVYLIAMVAQHEAGSYEGQVAVAAVILNRVASGSFPNTVSGVVYQPGQFTGAASLSKSEVSSQALSAARAALAGSDPTGGCLSFRSASSGYSGVNIGGNVFF